MKHNTVDAAKKGGSLSGLSSRALTSLGRAGAALPALTRLRLTLVVGAWIRKLANWYHHGAYPADGSDAPSATNIGSDSKCTKSATPMRIRATSNTDILRYQAEFLPEGQYLFFATVCRAWRDAWRPRAAVTKWGTPDATAAQLVYCFKSGLKPRFARGLCTAIARRGRLDLLQCARENGCPWDAQTCSQAARGGFLGILKWLKENGCPWDGGTCEMAAEGNHLELLQWAKYNGCPWNTRTLHAAAYGGHQEVLAWAWKFGCDCDPEVCSLAAEAGHFRLVKWLKENGAPWDSRTCTAAARCGRFEILIWVKMHGCPWDVDTCTAAADGGHLRILQLARAYGCAWDVTTSLIAAWRGHLDVLAWAAGHGCAIDGPRCYENAISGRHWHVASWLEMNGYAP